MRIDFTPPKKWDDLTEWQSDRIGDLLFRNEQQEKKLFKYALVFIVFLPKPSFINVLKAIILFVNIPLDELVEYTDFIFDNKQYMTRFRPCFKVRTGCFKKIKLYGPSSRLANISIQELSYADTFFFNWITLNQDIELHRLCAVLYRPSDASATEVDKRKKFNKLLLADNARLTDKIPLHQKYMIALAYQGTRQLLGERHPIIFPKSKEKSTVEHKKRKSYSPFTNIINSMVLDEVQPFGALEATEAANAHQFLEIYAERLLRDSKRSKPQKIKK